MHISQFASKLRCEHCFKPNKSNQWPINGDAIPFYYQDKPGNYTLPVLCPHCGKEWYVVWDQNPGSINLLDMVL
jgi:hypothetical protein